MCLAIYQAANKSISRQSLLNGYNNNQHGAGFCYPKDGKMEVEKGFFTFESFYEAYQKVPKDIPKLVHFRYRTHGEKSKENCHPFQIDEQTAMVHNGQFKQYSNKKNALSDTGQFVEEILKPMFAANPHAFTEKWAEILIEEFIGVGNKVAILNVHGEFAIYRPNMGEWVNGCWYSNDGYKTVKYKSNSTSYGVYQNNPSVHTNNVDYSIIEREFDMAEVDAVLERMTKERAEKRQGSFKINNAPTNFDGTKTQVLTTSISKTLEPANHGAE